MDKNNPLKYKLPSQLKYSVSKSFDKDQVKSPLLIQRIRDYIESVLFYWDSEPEKLKTFSFDLPGTIFTEKIESIENLAKEGKLISRNRGGFINDYNFNEVSYLDNTRDLSPEQFNDIWLKGQFSIKSKVEGLPYIWELAPFIAYGYNNIKDNFFIHLSYSYELIYTLKDRILYKPHESSLFGSFKKLYYVVKAAVGLFIGVPDRYLDNGEEKIKSQLFYDLWESYLNNPKFDVKFYNDETKNRLNLFINEFNIFWDKQVIESEQKYIDQNLSKQEVQDKLYQEKYQRIVSKMSDSNEHYKALFLEFLQSLIIIEKIESKSNEDINAAQIRVTNKVENDYYIRSKSARFLNDTVEAEMKVIREEIKKNANTEIIKELAKYELPSFIYNTRLKF